jgi:DNA-binding SARP family transcriptional activator/ABC-type branched-subunit amino acid transport system substrate-binding protein
VLRFNVLGPLEVLAGDSPLTLPAGKQRVLMAALLVEPNRAVSADLLIDRLWGGQPGSAAAKNLQVLVSQLRKVLADDGEGPIATVSSGYLLRVAPGATDVERFEELVAHARDQLDGGRPRDAERSLDEALALWRGGAYQDVAYEDFARDEIARLEDRRLHAIEQRFEAMLAGGRHADAVASLERTVADHPLRERLTGQLMLALYRCGRQAESLEAFERIRRRLGEELGIEPGPALHDLQLAILRQDPELGRPDRPPAMRPPAPGRPRLLLAAGGLLLIAAAVAAVVVATRGGESTLVQVTPNAVGVIDPGDLRVNAQYTTGSTPTSVATDGRLMWVLNADDGTISRIDIATADTITRNPGHAPVELAYGAGSVWVAYADPVPDGFSVGVLQLDPGTLRVERASQRLGTISQGEATFVSLAAAEGAVYVALWDRIDRLDASTLRVTARVRPGADALTVGEGAVWISRRGSHLFELDETTLAQRAGATIPTRGGLFRLAFGDGAVWGSDGSGVVWRVDPGPPVSAQSVRIGLSALDVTYGGGAAWATSGVDGIVARIDPHTLRVRRISIGGAPQRVVTGGGRVLVTVSGGATPAISPAPVGGLEVLPSSSCGQVVYGGKGKPDLLIASDLPLDAADAPVTQAMVQAIEYTLRRHAFRAGRFRVAFQPCDDSTAQVGAWDVGKCAANAKSYAQTSSVIGVIGTLNSGCALAVIPTLNRRSVAMVSPANSYIGLTKHGPGVAPGDPERLYPTGVRNYLRDYPGDDLQARADAVLAKQLGAHRVYVMLVDPNESYGQMLAQTFAASAAGMGMEVVGPSTPPARPDRLRRFVRSLDKRGVDAVFLAGVAPEVGGPSLSSSALLALRARFGADLTIIANDGFLGGFGRASTAPGDPTDGIYISGAYVSDPAKQLPPTGRRFVREFSATQPAHVINAFTPYAAQATEVLLSAIANSDGTRASVVSQLQRVRVTDGILGSFGFDRNGDMTTNLMPIFRVPESAGEPPPGLALPSGYYPVYTVIHVSG